MRIFITGSLAYDYLMTFSGRFAEHIIPERLGSLALSFLVDSLRRLRGGTAGNIAYNLALLGASPALVATAGQDFPSYGDALARLGVDIRGVRIDPEDFTASCFINTDSVNSQLVSFYPGAARAVAAPTLTEAGAGPSDLVVISPTNPASMIAHTRECQANRIPYIFDPGKQTPALSAADVLSGIDGAAVLVGNDYEFALMAKATGESEDKLLARAPLSIRSQGAVGSFIHARGRPVEHVPAVPEVTVADPTGAGDSFLAGFTFGYARGLTPKIAARIGTLAAAFCIEHRGCQEHYFERAAFAARYEDTFRERLVT